ncbi:hypothetical protein [Pseudomonas sp. KCJK8993]|uniref:hypothetical protein n=1 Tax=Pseudomonas sp. KCJK8993 TaxID=3344565 RepID=UPI0039060E0A
MTAAATTTFAHRLGSALGTAARFCLHDRNPMVRWIKRAIVLVVLGAVLVNSFSLIATGLLSLGSIGLVLLALTKVGGTGFAESNCSEVAHNPKIPRNGQWGYGYYDNYGNFKGMSNPDK